MKDIEIARSVELKQIMENIKQKFQIKYLKK